jgi:hypothetical protein
MIFGLLRNLAFAALITGGFSLAGCGNGNEAGEKNSDTPAGIELGVDENDDPRFPELRRLLPTTNELQLRSWSRGWFKKDPVRVVEISDLNRIVGKPSVYSAFNIKRILSTVYKTRESRVISVDLFQMESSDDAYGLFSVQKLSYPSKSLDKRSRYGICKKLSDVVEAYLCKGDIFVLFAGLAPARQSIDLMAETIASRHGAGSRPPELVRSLPEAGLIPDKIWFVRKAASLAAEGAEEIPCTNYNELDEILGTSARTELVVAAYKGDSPDNLNYVWAVRYPLPDEAAKAFDRYQEYKFSHAGRNDPVALNTTILSPESRLLLGSWTAEEESMSPILPALQKALQ